ncbi:hypothetical protein PC120_g8843 [Phytophthora cactorum]|nr:hypothetical protein PC120_g8843 [Phytophthora cactorum]
MHIPQHSTTSWRITTRSSRQTKTTRTAYSQVERGQHAPSKKIVYPVKNRQVGAWHPAAQHIANSANLNPEPRAACVFAFECIPRAEKAFTVARSGLAILYQHGGTPSPFYTRPACGAPLNYRYRFSHFMTFIWAPTSSAGALNGPYDAPVERLADKLGTKLSKDDRGVVTWDSGDFHYFEDVKQNGPLTCQYVFVLDALNFCFWPTQYMEYEHLARGLKTALLRDPHVLDADNLAMVTNETVTSWFHPFTPPQLDERRRKVREVGEVLQKFFDGQALNLIKKANFSAVEAIRLVLAYFPGFRDHALYKGEQVHFYKRAQILVGDVWAAYGRRTSGIASFHDIGKLTMFADYRVPQVLRPEGVLVYSSKLAELVDNKAEIPAGSEMELEIRAATIQAVEQIHKQMINRGHHLEVIELDWLLWQIGEDNKEDLLPHHRTWSIYY